MKGSCRNEFCLECGHKLKSCQGHKAATSYLKVALGSLSIGILATLSIWNICSKVAVAISQRYQAWPDMPQPPAPTLGTLGTPPSAPIFAEVLVIPSGKLPSNSELARELRLRLKQLVLADTKERVRVKLNQDIEGGRLYLNMEGIAVDYSAAFATVESADVAHIEGGVVEGKIYPVLYVSPHLLSDLSTASKSLRAMLSVSHESLHYDQWLAATEGSPEKKSFGHKAKLEELTSEECQRRWRVEHEAYKDTCELAIEWGVPEIYASPGMCVRVRNEAAFRQRLFVHMVSNPYANNLPMCVPTWAREAGHPHPWAYQSEADRRVNEHTGGK